jgi:hypothetical protein
MFFMFEYSAGSVYHRTYDLKMILHLLSIIVMLFLFLAHDKILLKLRPFFQSITIEWVQYGWAQAKCTLSALGRF